jgi:hypothetical protein
VNLAFSVCASWEIYLYPPSGRFGRTNLMFTCNEFGMKVPKLYDEFTMNPPNGVHAFCGCAIIQIFHPVDKIPHTRMSYHHLSHREYHMLVEIITQCRNIKMPQECNNCCHKTVASSFTRIQAWNIKSDG